MRPRGAITGMERTRLRSAHSETCRVDDRSFQKPMSSTRPSPDDVGDDGQSLLRQSIVVANQYDRKPARGVSGWRLARKPATSGRFVALPGILPGTPGLSRVTNRCAAWLAWYRNVLEKFAKISTKKIPKDSFQVPAGRTLPFEPRRVFRKRNTRRGQAASRPQVQFLSGTSCLAFSCRQGTHS